MRQLFLRPNLAALFLCSFFGFSQAFATTLRLMNNTAELPLICSNDRTAETYPDLRLSFSANSSYSRVRTNYTIRTNRTQPNRFYVLINPDFQIHGLSPEMTARKRQILQEKLRYCLTQANPHFFKPSMPDHAFEILVSDEAPPHPIELAETERSSSQNWDHEIDCSTMAHEVMHILGLPDEYIDIRFPRRVVQWTGIMGHNHAFQFFETVGNWPARILDCSVRLSESEMRACMALYNESFSRRLDFEALRESELNRLFVFEDHMLGRVQRNVTRPWYGAFIFANQTQRNAQAPRLDTSLLRDPHFDAVIYPGCMSGDRFSHMLEFYRASRRAYVRE